MNTTYDQYLNETTLAALRAAFMAIGPNNYTTEMDLLEQPEAWKTWVVGLAFITLCSFSAPLGILILPCLPKWLYERIMSLLIALGIGTLSGSCFFIMIPQAFAMTNTESGMGYAQKSWIIVGSLYAFFAFDRLLQYIFEIRRRRVRRRIHLSDIKHITVGPPKRQETIETVVTDENGDVVNEMGVDAAERGENGGENGGRRRNQLEIAVLNNIVARTFSTRRRVAMVKVDEIALDRSDVRSAPVTPGGSTRITGETLRRVNSDLHHINDISTATTNMYAADAASHDGLQPATASSAAAANDRDEELSVSVQVVEKRVIDPKDLEIASIAYILIVGSSVNNFLDGMSMGAGFADSLVRGVSIGISSFSQQFPQEVGQLAILANSGLGIKRTLLVNLIPAFLSYTGFVVGVVLDNVDESYDNYVFAVSAGMYLYVFLGTLIPEIRESTEELIKTDMRESLLVTLLQAIGISVGVTFMYFMNKINDVELS